MCIRDSHCLARRLKGHGEDLGAQCGEVVALLAQLRKVLPAGHSAQPAQKDQQHRLAAPVAQRQGLPGRVKECKIGRQIAGDCHDRPIGVMAS